MGKVHPLPIRWRHTGGTIHVWGDPVDGFSVSHESASGNSWGDIRGPFRSGEEAITIAYAMNRDEYGGSCDVSVCDAAIQDGSADAGLVSLPGDF